MQVVNLKAVPVELEGRVVVAVNGEPVSQWDDVVAAVQASSRDTPLLFKRR